MPEDASEEEVGDVLGIGVMAGWDDFCVLGEAIDDGEDGGVVVGLGKGADKVVGEVLPGCLWYFEGLEWCSAVLSDGFVLLTFGTALDVSLYGFEEVWPVVMSLDEFLGLVDAWMAGGGMVVMLLEDGLLNGTVTGYENLPVCSVGRVLSDTVVLSSNSSCFLLVVGVLLVELSELGNDGGFGEGKRRLFGESVDLDPIAGNNLKVAVLVVAVSMIGSPG